MARKQYPGLTSTENRQAKYIYQRPSDPTPGMCILIYSEFYGTYSLYNVKDVNTGATFKLDSRTDHFKGFRPMVARWCH